MTEEVIPRSTYEVVEGTNAVEHGKHEPRTVKRTRTEGDEVTTSMMTEIGDGVFVNWSQCASCSKLVDDCGCTGGPKEPAYMTKWRDERFQITLNARPEVEFTVLPKVVTALKQHGLKVFTEDELKEYAAAIRETMQIAHEEEKHDESPEGTEDDPEAVED